MSPITDGAWPDFSPLIATAKKSATESSRVACIINRRREGFFFIPARVKCQWEISTRCTLTLGDHCAYWHSPHRGVESDRLRPRRFIHAPTDTWQRQMISTSSVNSRALVLFCRRHKQELKLSSCYFERLVLWWECFHTKLILLWISKDVHLVLSVIFHSLFTSVGVTGHWAHTGGMCWTAGE